MALNEPNMCINVAACICAKDGIISEVEEQSMFDIISERFPDFKAGDFDAAMDAFFNSDDQIEDYLLLIDDEGLRQFTLALAADSAGADGLDIRENIALEKAYSFWGIHGYV